MFTSFCDIVTDIIYMNHAQLGKGGALANE